MKQILLSVIYRCNGVNHSYLKETTTRQKRVEKKFGQNVCGRTRQSGDRPSWQVQF